jgi:hypothetical protein
MSGRSGGSAWCFRVCGDDDARPASSGVVVVLGEESTMTRKKRVAGFPRSTTTSITID